MIIIDNWFSIGIKLCTCQATYTTLDTNVTINKPTGSKSMTKYIVDLSSTFVTINKPVGSEKVHV